MCSLNELVVYWMQEILHGLTYMLVIVEMPCCFFERDNASTIDVSDLLSKLLFSIDKCERQC